MNTEKNKEKIESSESHNHDQVAHVHGPNCNHHHHHELLKPITRDAPKVGRNDPCICGSEKKYKKCCGI